MSISSTPIEIFYSYVDTDEPLLNKLEKHLILLQHEGLIAPWHKRRITAGADVGKTLDQHLNTASIILLLISAEFLASDYCYGIEVQRAMERHEAGDACVIPILLCPVDNWQSAPFGRLQALPRNGKPLTEWHNRERAFADIAKGIREKLESVQPLSPQLEQRSTSQPRGLGKFIIQNNAPVQGQNIGDSQQITQHFEHPPQTKRR